MPGYVSSGVVWPAAFRQADSDEVDALRLCWRRLLGTNTCVDLEDRNPGLFVRYLAPSEQNHRIPQLFNRIWELLHRDALHIVFGNTCVASYPSQPCRATGTGRYHHRRTAHGLERDFTMVGHLGTVPWFSPTAQSTTAE